MIRYGDIEVPRAAIAQLAVRLHRSGERWLSYHIGRAIDDDLEELVLVPNDYEPILRELRREPIAGLDEFHAVLEAQQPNPH